MPNTPNQTTTTPKKTPTTTKNTNYAKKHQIPKKTPNMQTKHQIPKKHQLCPKKPTNMPKKHQIRQKTPTTPKNTKYAKNKYAQKTPNTHCLHCFVTKIFLFQIYALCWCTFYRPKKYGGVPKKKIMRAAN